MGDMRSSLWFSCCGSFEAAEEKAEDEGPEEEEVG